MARSRLNPSLAWTYIGFSAFLLAWQAVLWWRVRYQGLNLHWEFAPVASHYIQASVQFSIYAYWGWYWRNVYAEAPLILSQVVFLYVATGLLTWTRGQTWRVGFGPWPIIFSTNLFMWFRDDWYYLQFLMVLTGVFGKNFVAWNRDGKRSHIFNPSAFGLTIFSLALIFSGKTHWTWAQEIATTQGLAPHMYLEIFLCGMVVQYFFAVTLMTFSAAATIALFSLLYQQVTGVYFFVDSNIPIAVFLGLHLLMTDPATTPRLKMGRVIFGSLYGMGVVIGYVLLSAANTPSFYDKLVVVPLLNLLAPALDRFVSMGWLGRLTKWEHALAPRKMNLAYMGVWASVFGLMLVTGFVDAPHPGATIGFWKRAAEAKRFHAAENLALLLHEFESQDLDDTDKLVGDAGGPAQDRRESLGVLCNQVGIIYLEGKVTPPNMDKALYYFSKASEFGNFDGSANLALQMVVLGHTNTHANLEPALSMLEERSGSVKDGRINLILGSSYETGLGRPVDKAKARHYYDLAAAAGDIESSKRLGRMECLGEGGPADSVSAARWLQVAANANDGLSCMYLARLYHLGEGVPRDDQRANALLQQACNLGVQPACQLLQQPAP